MFRTFAVPLLDFLFVRRTIIAESTVTFDVSNLHLPSFLAILHNLEMENHFADIIACHRPGKKFFRSKSECSSMILNYLRTYRQDTNIRRKQNFHQQK